MPPELFVVTSRRSCDGWSASRNRVGPSQSSRMCLTEKSSSRRFASSIVPSTELFGWWPSGMARNCQESLPPNTGMQRTALARRR